GRGGWWAHSPDGGVMLSRMRLIDVSHVIDDGMTTCPELLVESGAVLVGIDSVNIDDTGGGERPAHTSLLAAGIPVVEHLADRAPSPTRVPRSRRSRPRSAGW